MVVIARESEMPTAAKFVAALSFALLGFLAGEMLKPHVALATWLGVPSMISDGSIKISLETLSIFTGGLGLLTGWFVLGPRVGQGMLAAALAGISAMVTMVVGALMSLAAYQTIQAALRKKFDTISESMVGYFQYVVDDASLLNAPDVLVTLFVGSILAGLLCEWANRRWR